MKAQLYNYHCWITETDPAMLRQELDQMLRLCGFDVLGFMEHHFQPYGYTCIWLLSESHLAVHTYPEENKTYVELTSCVQEKKVRFGELLLKRFEPATADC